MLSDIGDWGLQKIGFASWYHDEPNLNILLTRNLPFDTDVRQWSFPLVIHCIVCVLDRTTEPQVNLNVTWLGFVFVLISFVYMHGSLVVP